jgi:hypothetical protein
MRRIAGGVATVAIAALAGLPAGAAAENTIVPSSVERSATVPAGGARSLRLACPDTAVALHAAVVRLPGGAGVSDSIPGSSARRWTIRLAGAASGDRKVTAVLRCVRLRLPLGVSGVTLRVASGSRPSLAVAPRDSARAGLTCPQGYAPTGYGFGASSTAVSLAAAVPTRRGWRFRVENGGGSPTTAAVRIRCLQPMVRGRRGGRVVRLRFGLQRLDFRRTVPTGDRESLRGFCARDHISVASGVALDPSDDILLRTTYPAGGSSARWSFGNTGAPAQIRAYMLCLARFSRFG